MYLRGSGSHPLGGPTRGTEFASCPFAALIVIRIDGNVYKQSHTHVMVVSLEFPFTCTGLANARMAPGA